ncbi:hypothetical protein BDZ91DRAFT_761445 [Kalaharituber pfeilii]|nr:hypothetical protein BDZ91DRAFT_761445 [Kalaharituber pfeilii]
MAWGQGEKDVARKQDELKTSEADGGGRGRGDYPDTFCSSRGRPIAIAAKLGIQRVFLDCPRRWLQFDEFGSWRRAPAASELQMDWGRGGEWRVAGQVRWVDAGAQDLLSNSGWMDEWMDGSKPLCRPRVKRREDVQEYRIRRRMIGLSCGGMEGRGRGEELLGAL